MRLACFAHAHARASLPSLTECCPLRGRVPARRPCRAHDAARRPQVQAICRLVVRRSARMASLLLVAVLRLQGWTEAPRRLVVAVDGGVFLKYHNWRRFLDHYLREAFGEANY